MKDDLLPLELRLLVLRYGRQAVSDELARISSTSKDEIQEQLAARRQKGKAPRKARKPLRELILEEFGDRKDISPMLLELAAKFESKEFLPSLREVHRFIARSGSDDRTFKSRSEAAPALFRLIARLDRDTLTAINQQSARSQDGAFALLARAIMRSDTRRT